MWNNFGFLTAVLIVCLSTGEGFEGWTAADGSEISPSIDMVLLEITTIVSGTKVGVAIACFAEDGTNTVT